MTPLSPQPTSLLTAGRGAFSPLALATRTHARTHARTHVRTHAPAGHLPIPQVDLEGTIKAGGDMFEDMAGVDHAKALEEVRPPAYPPPNTSCGGKLEPSL